MIDPHYEIVANYICFLFVLAANFHDTSVLDQKQHTALFIASIQ